MDAKKKPSFPHKGCGIRGAKKERHRRKGSGTAGSGKAKSCKADYLERWFCRCSRAYKTQDYVTVGIKMNRKLTSAGT